ncbi:MAG: ABC transporter substrate-binding protein [Porphyromonadaceae bacterium]|nr:ABC transporter substrate-binding protein [Porphyromonadaceae bacterium]
MSFKSLLFKITLSINLLLLNTLAMAVESPRLINMSPHLTETVYDLGLEAQLVATDVASNFPEAVKDIAKIGSGLNPNQELLLLYQPDIILSFAPSLTLEKLQQTQAVDIVISQPNSVPTLFDDWRKILEIAQKDPQKKLEIEEKLYALETEWRTTTTSYENKGTKNIFFLISAQPLYTLSDKAFLSQALKACNTHNIFADIEQVSFIVNPEDLLLKQPEIIIHGYNVAESNGKERAKNEVMQHFNKLGIKLEPQQLVSVDVDILHRPTMRFMKVLPEICTDIHAAQAE